MTKNQCLYYLLFFKFLFYILFLRKRGRKIQSSFFFFLDHFWIVWEPTIQSRYWFTLVAGVTYLSHYYCHSGYVLAESPGKWSLDLNSGNLTWCKDDWTSGLIVRSNIYRYKPILIYRLDNGCFEFGKRCVMLIIQLSSSSASEWRKLITEDSLSKVLPNARGLRPSLPMRNQMVHDCVLCVLKKVLADK